jgi:hypothetical protein
LYCEPVIATYVPCPYATACHSSPEESSPTGNVALPHDNPSELYNAVCVFSPTTTSLPLSSPVPDAFRPYTMSFQSAVAGN